MRPAQGFLNTNLTKYVAPGEFLTTAEILYHMRHQTTFWQYNPNNTS